MNLYTSVGTPTFNETTLTDIATTQGYGYKTANLFELQKIIKSFNKTKQPIKVQVPEFVGISSNLVVNALNKVDFNIAEQWKIVLDTIPSDEKKSQALACKKIPESFWIAQKNFITKLRTAFNKLNKENPFEFNKQHKQALTDLFITANQNKLMVRSTGKEDTRKLANAGGNESIANVEPTMDGILTAAQEVIASYFSEKSLNQRLGLGDITLFSEEIFCPLLIQRMIGEIKGKEIPSCGVMFTEEVEGGISYKEELDESGKIKTTGISLIQAAYGHNELVVNSTNFHISSFFQISPGSINCGWRCDNSE